MLRMNLSRSPQPGFPGSCLIFMKYRVASISVAERDAPRWPEPASATILSTLTLRSFMTEPRALRPDLVWTRTPVRVGSSPSVRPETNWPSSVSSTPENLWASSYLIRLRPLRVSAFLLRTGRGTLCFLETSLRTEVMEAGTLGTLLRMRT